MKRGRETTGIPITPDKVAKKLPPMIPPEVIDAFNELIVANMDENGSAKLMQDEVVALVLKKLPGTKREEVYDKKWLDVESIFRGVGWTVTYDKPAYCETYAAYFIFTK